MASRRELGFPKPSYGNLREQLARTTLNNVRSQGHTYVELREAGKRLVFFCTLCMSPCYSDSVLFDHLKGNLHTERLNSAKATLLKPNPFPFNDGLRFFHGPTEKTEQLTVCNTERTSLFKLALENLDEEKSAIVCYNENLSSGSNGHTVLQDNALQEENTDSSAETEIFDVDQEGAVVVPGVLLRDKVSDLAVRYGGLGKIAARFYANDCVSYEICKIWCEWIGKEVTNDHVVPTIEEHEFAVVTFRYNYNLGRKGLLDDLKLLLPPSSPRSESEETSGTEMRKRKSFSDPEDVGELLNSRYDSSGEESQFSNNSNSRFVIDVHDDQQLHARIMSSKRVRKELRRQQRLAAERMCAICQQKMLPGKDVATLLNRTTGRLACSSRNFTGAFHICHVSCLVHWILLCELELITKPSVAPSVKRKSRRKTGSKSKDTGKNGDANAMGKQRSVFCPECQGTGMNIKGEELERPTVNLSEIFKYKIKLSDGQKAWMKNPEVLPNCSTGFYFPPQADDVNQEYVSPLKVIRFYNAEDYQ